MDAAISEANSAERARFFPGDSDVIEFLLYIRHGGFPLLTTESQQAHLGLLEA